MPKRKEIPDQPRYGYAAETAYRLLLDMDFDSFPILPSDIIDRYPDRIIVLPWSKARDILESVDPYHLHQLNAEARTMHVRGSHLYTIIYDDVRITNPDRIRWTIMHELGHICLKHLVHFENTGLNRGGLTKREYGVLEQEAHRFAAEVFMPSAFFRGMRIDRFALRLVCGVSQEAADRQYNKLQDMKYYGSGKYDDALYRAFCSFFYRNYSEMLYNGIRRIWGQSGYRKYVPYSRKCPTCHAYNSLQDAHCCIYCGSLLEPDASGVYSMARKKSEENLATVPGKSIFHFLSVERKHPNGKGPSYHVYCPVCLNHAITADSEFCRICGQPLQNRCLEEHKIVPLGARLCPDCGRPTSYLRAYQTAEQRFSRLDEYANRALENADWIEYPYWDYIRFSALRQGNYDLTSALYYSKAYEDDNGNLRVFVVSAAAERAVINDSVLLFSMMNEHDATPHERMEVYNVNAI